MLMHNHNVQYPNLRDYREIEQWQGRTIIPIMVHYVLSQNNLATFWA